jgi:hypothetical protein
VQVGIVHNHMEYEPKHPLAFSAAWVAPIVRVINQAWVSTAPRMASCIKQQQGIRLSRIALF